MAWARGSEAEYRAAKELLCLVWPFEGCLDDEQRAIDWERGMEHRALLSSGENVLVETALELWSGSPRETSFARAIDILDEGRFRALLRALAIRRGLEEATV